MKEKRQVDRQAGGQDWWGVARPVSTASATLIRLDCQPACISSNSGKTQQLNCRLLGHTTGAPPLPASVALATSTHPAAPLEYLAHGNLPATLLGLNRPCDSTPHTLSNAFTILF